MDGEQAERDGQSMLTLVFNDKRLESQYMEHEVLEKYTLHDRWLVIAHAAAFAAHQLVFWMVSREGSELYRWTVYAYGAVLALHIMAVHCLPRGAYVTYRNCITCWARTCLMILYLLEPSNGVFDFGYVRTDAAFMKVCLRSTGVLIHGWLALLMPLPTCFHLYLQGLFTILSIWWSKDRACSHVCLGQDGNSCMSQPVADDICMEATGDFAHKKFALMFEYLSFWHRYFMANGSDSSDHMPQDPRLLCLTVITFLQLLLGFILPTIIIYAFESWSRATFLERITESDPSQRGDVPERNLVFERLYEVVVRLLQLLALTYIAWEMALLNLLGAKRMNGGAH